MNYTNVNIKIQEYKQYMKKIERNCIESIRNKKVYCYGAGKVFKDFLCTYPDIKDLPMRFLTIPGCSASAIHS